MNRIREKFLNLAGKDTVIAGIGNPQGGDDAAGLLLLEGLRDKIQAEFIECGIAPENYLGRIVASKPSVVIFLDAVELGKTPGTIQIISPEELDEQGLGTHDISPGICIEYLRERIKGVSIYILGIQPSRGEPCEFMSKEVKNAIESFLQGF